MDDDETFRIAVLGAGPVGLEAALYGRYLGYVVSLYDDQDVCAALVERDRPLDSTFRENCTPLGLASLAAQDPNYRHPSADEILSVEQWASRYCLPLSQTDLVAGTLRIGSTVESVDFFAESETYNLVARRADGSTVTDTCDYVIDTRSSCSHPADELLSDFAASKTDDFFVIESGRESFDFRSAVGAIRRAYAIIGERDELDVYGTLKQFHI